MKVSGRQSDISEKDLTEQDMSASHKEGRKGSYLRDNAEKETGRFPGKVLKRQVEKYKLDTVEGRKSHRMTRRQKIRTYCYEVRHSHSAEVERETRLNQSA